MRRVWLLEELSDASSKFCGGRGKQIYFIYEKNTLVSQVLFKRGRIGLAFNSGYSEFLLEACSLPDSIIPWVWNTVCTYGAYCIQYWLQNFKSSWQKKNVQVTLNMQGTEKPLVNSGISYFFQCNVHCLLMCRSHKLETVLKLGFSVTIWSCYFMCNTVSVMLYVQNVCNFLLSCILVYSWLKFSGLDAYH